MEGIVNRFKGKLIETIKNADSKFDDYSISLKIRQILLHWGCELTQSDLLRRYFFVLVYRKNYYWFNRQELLEKAKEKYNNKGGKEKAAKYYQDNKDILKEKARKKYKNLSEEEKKFKEKYSINRYKKIKSKK